MTNKTSKTIPFNTEKSIRKAAGRRAGLKHWKIDSGGKTFKWSTKMERVNLIREGIPFASIEVISDRLASPIRTALSIVGIPQTTYNKKKREESLLDSRHSELILVITELLDFGLEVFNEEEEKFQRWLKKPNLSLGGHAPESLLDTTTGIDEVHYALNRIEFGNFA